MTDYFTVKRNPELIESAVLDKIRDEIEALPRELPTDARNMVRRTRVLDIIDRHMKGADK